MAEKIVTEMRRTAALVLAFVLFASVAQAELRIPAIVLVGGHVGDGVFTTVALGRGCVEANGIYGTRPSVGRLVVTKALVIVPTLLAMRSLERSGHPKWAAALGYVGGGVSTAAAVSNAVQTCGGGR